MFKYIIQLEDIIYDYPDGTRALNDITINIPEGKKIAFLGPNGAGKTTLFFIMNCVYRARKGRVIYKGKEINYKKDELINLRKNVAIVFQDPNVQLFSLSVFQEISMGPNNLGLSKSEVLKRVNKAMEETDILHLKDKPTHFLSYGQKKLVSIASILAMEPEVIIMDEPTVWLDPKHKKKITDIIGELSKRKTVLIATHNVNFAYEWADYIFVMKDGKIFARGKSEHIFKDEKLLSEVHLEKPFILEIYDYLLEKGFISSSSLPGTKRELFELIDKCREYGGDELSHINFCLNYL